MKKHKFVILQFWRSEVSKGSGGTKIKELKSVGLLPSPGSWRRILACLFQSVEAAYIPGLLAASLPLLPLSHLLISDLPTSLTTTLMIFILGPSKINAVRR